MEEVQSEVDERTGCRHLPAGAVGEQNVLLDEVPAARTHHDRGRLLGGDGVLLAFGAREAQFPADRVAKGQLTFDDVPPGGARGVLLVGQPHLRARVERVDGHLRIGGAGDLDAAVFEAGPGAGDLPLGVLADVCRFIAEARVVPVSDLEAAPHAVGETIVASAGEAVVQRGEEVECLRCEDLVVAGSHAADDRDRRVGVGEADGIRGGRDVRGGECHGTLLSTRFFRSYEVGESS